MTLFSGPTKWYDLMAQLRDAAYAALSPSPAQYGIVPGQIAFDSGDCAALYLTLMQNYPTIVFPQPVQEPNGNCDDGQDAAEIVLVVSRCVPGPDGSQTLAPSPAALDASARQYAADAFALDQSVRAVLCARMADNSIVDYMVGPSLPIGPSGGAVAVEMHVFVELIRG